MTVFRGISGARNVLRFNPSQLTVCRLSSTIKKESDWPRKIVSGVQPTGILHIGNYFGAVKRWVDFQDAGENVSYFLADLHSITMPHEPKKLKQDTLQMVATLLACGIDPQKSHLFVQSTVPQHAEMCWILGCVSATMARLAQLPQYKEKSAMLNTQDSIPLGLYVYPVLQAADILLYKATHVPTGEDQLQQLQLTMHFAGTFNTRFGSTFPIIKEIVSKGAGGRIRSLRDPEKKMSKSDPTDKGRIVLTDTPEAMARKIKRAVTDCISAVEYNPQERPGVSNLITIHSLVTGLSVEEICAQSKSTDTGAFKLVVADSVVEYFQPMREKLLDYMKNRDYLEKVIKNGRDVACETAAQTLKEVKKKVGFFIPKK